ncbi:acetyltransferase [Corynebacterium sp. TAE3-ERU12]|uniref:GNAT family N-acetyltransferase n=1 Tax=Corynebacterium sp. TAE3-ERU12 TaxID=2849491 RepID=UPI001C47B5F3|nr:GNAT family N-acetyltransferase [Corynebacterium sp. TAE3-ERU12]MBV7294614.1 acetyltransferase [Corynebacterium sp. TAE3-ERU12]
MDTESATPDRHGRHRLLHRLLLDKPSGPPPPLPAIPAPFEVRVADDDEAAQDADLVSEWMSRPHLVSTWEQPWTADRWRADWRAKKESGYAVPLIVHFEHTPAAYVELYRPHRDEIGLCYLSAPSDLGFHIAVGSSQLTGRGIFSRFVGLLAPALLAADPTCELLVADPDYRNVPAQTTLRKTGWCDCGEIQQRPGRRVRLFMYPADGVDPAQRTDMAPE